LGPGDYDFVGSDHEAGTYLATEHLIKQGHRRITFLGRKGGGVVYEQRRAGYVRALATYGMVGSPAWVIDVPPTRAGGRDGMLQVLALADRPTAVVCYNDIVAFGALAALGEKGLAAGRDLAVIGFDGVAATEHSNPPLSTMDVAPGRLGEIAAEVLLARLADPTAPANVRVATPRLVVRQSTAAFLPARAEQPS
jgi:LacI family transcriptional regulator